MDSKPISHITAGLMIAALIILFSLITQFTGMSASVGVGAIQYLLIIIALIYFVNRWGRANHYRESFGNLFAYGFKTTTVYALINVGFIILFFLLFPDIKEKSFEIVRQQMEKNPNVSDEQIDEAVEITRKFFWVSAIGGTTIFLVIIGAIGSLIGAAVTKKNPNHPFDQVHP